MGKYLVQSATKAQTKRGKSYLRLRLFDETGHVWPAVMWESRDLEAGVVIDAIVEKEDYNGETQLNVKAFRETGEAPSDLFLPKTKANTEDLFQELLYFASVVSDPNLRVLLEKALEDPRWKRAPAAKMIHHAYLGGLLEHTVNLCRLGTAVADLYPTLRRDLLITAAVLHDIGKMDEMECTTNIEYTSQGNLLGHIAIGYERVLAWMTELGTPPEHRLLVKHLILSHHGSTQYGSPKPPQIIEAQVFSNLDGLDANMGTMLASIEKTPAGKEWTDKPFAGQALFLGNPGPLGTVEQRRGDMDAKFDDKE